MQPLYTVRETADILRLSIRTVQMYALQLGGKKYGKVWRFLPEAVERVRREGIRGVHQISNAELEIRAAGKISNRPRGRA